MDGGRKAFFSALISTTNAPSVKVFEVSVAVV